jgi:hypothetical protein
MEDEKKHCNTGSNKRKSEERTGHSTTDSGVRRKRSVVYLYMSKFQSLPASIWLHEYDFGSVSPWYRARRFGRH